MVVSFSPPTSGHIGSCSYAVIVAMQSMLYYLAIGRMLNPHSFDPTYRNRITTIAKVNSCFFLKLYICRWHNKGVRIAHNLVFAASVHFRPFFVPNKLWVDEVVNVTIHLCFSRKIHPKIGVFARKNNSIPLFVSLRAEDSAIFRHFFYFLT